MRTEPGRRRSRLAAVPPTLRRPIAFALITVAAALAACSSGAAPTPTPPQGLAGRTFLSVAVTDGGADRPLVPGTRIRLDLRDVDLTVSSGCNTMGGRYHIDGGQLIVEQMSTTDMGCPAAHGAQDTWLAHLLGAHPTITLSGNELALASGSVVIRLMDRAVVDPDRPLVGPTWTVDSIINGGAVSSVPSDVPPATLVFKADGTVTVFTGCNQGSAKWSTAGTTIALSELVLTKVACAGSGAALESAVVGVLGAGSLGLAISADSLTLQAGANGLQLRAR